MQLAYQFKWLTVQCNWRKKKLSNSDQSSGWWRQSLKFFFFFSFFCDSLTFEIIYPLHQWQNGIWMPVWLEMGIGMASSQKKKFEERKLKKVKVKLQSIREIVPFLGLKKTQTFITIAEIFLKNFLLRSSVRNCFSLFYFTSLLLFCFKKSSSNVNYCIRINKINSWWVSKSQLLFYGLFLSI